MQIRRQRPRTAANGFEKQDEASEAFKDIIIKYNIINDMTRHKLSGAGAAIPTPFTPDGRVDYPALARTIDYIIDGPSYDKLLFIISDRQDEIREFILDKMDRGGTYIKSTGMYTAQQRDMIFLVVSRNEVSILQNMIHQIDPASFVVIVDAYETYGDGFKAFPEKK